MRRVELTQATKALSEYVRDVGSGPVLVVKRGRPVAAVVPMSAEEWENYRVTHPPLVESTRRAMERFKAEGGSSLEGVMRRFGRMPKPTPHALRRPARISRRRIHK